MKCGFCEANLTTYFTSNGKNPLKHCYYKCTTVIKQGSHQCPSRLVPAKDLEEFTQGLMIHTVKEEGFFDAITAQITDNSDDELGQMVEERQRLSGNLAAVQRKADNLLGNLADGIIEKAAKRRMGKMLEDIENQKAEIEQSIAELDARKEEVTSNKFQKQVLNQVLKEFAALYEDASVESKTKMLKMVVSEIKVSAKSGEQEGTFEFKLRGDGNLVRRWDQVINKRGVGLTPRVGGLRE